MTWLMIGKTENRETITRVNPEACTHEHTVLIQTGHMYTFRGEAEDDIDYYEQCLDCGWVMRDDGTWGPYQNDLETLDEGIPF